MLLPTCNTCAFESLSCFRTRRRGSASRWRFYCQKSQLWRLKQLLPGCFRPPPIASGLSSMRCIEFRIISWHILALVGVWNLESTDLSKIALAWKVKASFWTELWQSFPSCWQPIYEAPAKLRPLDAQFFFFPSSIQTGNAKMKNKIWNLNCTTYHVLWARLQKIWGYDAQKYDFMTLLRDAVTQLGCRGLCSAVLDEGRCFAFSFYTVPAVCPSLPIDTLADFSKTDAFDGKHLNWCNQYHTPVFGLFGHNTLDLFQ